MCPRAAARGYARAPVLTANPPAHTPAGMSLFNAMSSGTTAVLSFLAFWLVFGERMRVHSCGEGCEFYLAPAYLAMTVLGMFGMVFADGIAARLFGREGMRAGTWSGPDWEGAQPLLEAAAECDSDADGSAQPGSTESGGTEARVTTTQWVTGVMVSILGGVFASLQYAVVTLGKRWSEEAAGCYGAGAPACPPRVSERFDDTGSWMMSFGAGALGTAGVLYALTPLLQALARRSAADKRARGAEADQERGAETACVSGGRGRGLWFPNGYPLPDLHWSVLRTAGVAAGTFWVGGNYLNTMAVSRGGQSTVMALYVSMQLVTSGLWGILYYREGGSFSSKAVWSASAVFTLAAVVLLGLEKA